MNNKTIKNYLRANESSEQLITKIYQKTAGEKGSSLVITLLMMFLLLGFVALALSRTTSETIVSKNDESEVRTFDASQAGLENATRDLASVFENKISPSTSDITSVQNSTNALPNFANKFTINTTVSPVGDTNIYTIPDGDFQGLYSLRDEYQVDVKSKELNSDVEVELMRRFYNNRIPLFQFGAFYNDDLELNRPPLFTFGGKVHSNGNIFVTADAPSSSPASAGIYFNSKVTASGEIVNDIWKTGTSLNTVDSSGKVFIPNASGVNQELTTGNGSVTCTTGTGSTVLTLADGRNYPYPNCVKNNNWAAFSTRFEGNLKANTAQLNLPITKIGSDLIEMMRRGKNVGDKMASGTSTPVAVTTATDDNPVLSKERFANKTGIRISLADSKDELPQCATVTTACGVQLDKSCNSSNNCNGVGGNSLGYQPKALSGTSYKTTAVNGNRLAINGAETWIKIEKVTYDSNNNVPVTKDITEDILSLGMTESFYNSDNPYNGGAPNLKMPIYDTTTNAIQDSWSIVKIQHFLMDGQLLPTSTYVSNKTVNLVNYNFVSRNQVSTSGLSGSNLTKCNTSIQNNLTGNCVVSSDDAFAPPVTDNSPSTSGTVSGTVSSDERDHYKVITVGTNPVSYQIVPFPIEMYDSREGDRRDSAGTAGSVYRNGVMSLVDIDVANLRRFLKGDFDGKLPNNTLFAASNGNVGLKSTDIPDNRGWVLYFSDRRGDRDFDGRYDMENVNPNSTTSLIDQDLDKNGIIDMDTTFKEAPRTDQEIDTSWSAVTDHGYYRRAVRLINGTSLPGIYDSITEANTKGFTIASENGVYVLGNYNVSSVTLSGSSAPAPATSYFPQNTALHIPASIVGDSVTILSNNWNDSNSFVNPYDTTKRDASDTQVRFGMISGDSLTASTQLSNGNFDGLNGGLHNFMRFLEHWNGNRLNYSGSLINLFNSYNNNGRWKCCTTVYDPPVRDWTFDTTFNNPDRLPPGAPYVYYLSLTGFERINE